jgi:DNA-binding NarL/FixJ family response regulator
MRRKSRGHRREQQNKKWAFPDPSSITSSPSHRIRVFIADSQEVVRAGVCKLLEGERDLEIVGEADNAKGVLSESGRTKPDVVLLESGLSGGSEFNIYKTLFNVLPSVRIIEAGAQGYLRENTGRIELIRAIRTVANGMPTSARRPPIRLFAC